MPLIKQQKTNKANHITYNAYSKAKNQHKKQNGLSFMLTAPEATELYPELATSLRQHHKEQQKANNMPMLLLFAYLIFSALLVGTSDKAIYLLTK